MKTWAEKLGVGKTDLEEVNIKRNTSIFKQIIQKGLIPKSSWFCLKQLYVLAESLVKVGGRLLNQENTCLGGENSPCLGKQSHGRPTALDLV